MRENPEAEQADALGVVSAAPGRRAAAFALDAAVWVALSIPTIVGAVLALPLLAGDAIDVALPALFVAIGVGLTGLFGIVQLVLHGRRGITLGKAALGLRSVREATLGPVGFWRVVLRALVLSASSLALVVVGPALLFASGLRDPRGRSLLDRLAGARVVDARSGLDPFDARALRLARRELERPTGVASLAPRPLDSRAARPFDVGAARERSSAGVVSVASASWTAPPLRDAAPAAAAAPTTAPAPAAAPTTAPAPAVVAPAPTRAPQQPAPATAPPLSPAVPPRTVVLEFDDGTTVPAPAAGLLGRAPEAAAGERADLLLPLRDPSMQLSKTHAAFGVDASGFWMLDRGSSNGTVARTPAGDRALTPGERTSIPPGSTVLVGGRSFRVVAA